MFFIKPNYTFAINNPTNASYIGFIKSIEDAVYIVEATRRGLLNPIHQRLTTEQRKQLKSGAVFIWEQNLSGIQRWTDGKNWSASRYLDHFLIYKEIKPSLSDKKIRSYKQACGLCKRTITIVTKSNAKYHIINYYNEEDINQNLLNIPSLDPKFKDICLPKIYYINDTIYIDDVNVEQYLPKSRVEFDMLPKNQNITIKTGETSINLQAGVSDPVLYYSPRLFSHYVKNQSEGTFPKSNSLELLPYLGQFVLSNSKENTSSQKNNPNKNPKCYNDEDQRQLELLRKNLSL